MGFYENLNENEIIDALTFFPGLKAIKEIENKLTTGINKQIEKISTTNANKDKSDVLSLLINRYFKLSAYEDLESLDSKDWMLQFYFRKSILSQLEKPNPNDRPNDLQSMIYVLINHPIARDKNYFFACRPYSSINDLAVLEAYRASEKYINDGSFKTISENPSLIPSVDELNYGPYHDHEDKMFDLYVTSVANDLATADEPTVIATIDLNATDEKIKEDFAQYLTKKRKELGIENTKPKEMKKSNYTSLIKHKVLQYIDLTILDIYINETKTLKQRQIADCLFPDSSQTNKDTTEAIRKSTIKYANKILDEKMITSLFNLADERPFFASF